MGSKVLIILAVACLSCEIVSAATDKVICYHGSWSANRNGNGKFTVNDIDPTLCTHLIYAFVGIRTDGNVNILNETLDISNGNLANFNSLKNRNSALKTLIAVGGWNEGSTNYSNMAASATLRATFIQSALDLILTYGFDGFDLDWEYPGQRGGSSADKENYVTLIKEFREVFDQHGLLLTAAVAATGTSADISYDVPALSQYLDIINVMTYDLHGSWDGVTGQNAPLYASSIDTSASAQQLNVAASIEAWISRGADPQKLAQGLAIYGRTYTLTDSNNTALGAPISGAGNPGPYTLEGGTMGYNEICEQQLQGGWTTVWDDEQKVPYTYKNDQWVGYDNARSIGIKVNYAKSLNLGGVMIWSIETEDFRGICGTKYPLLNAIKSALRTVNGNVGDDSAAVENTTSGDCGAAVAETTTVAPANDNSNGDIASDTGNNSGSSTPTCTSSGYIRDPTNCNIFYYCVLVGSTYVPIAQKCSSNLYFDETALTCNWPELVCGCN